MTPAVVEPLCQAQRGVMIEYIDVEFALARQSL